MAELFAGIRVSDFKASLRWYATLLGREPAFLPHDTEAVWEIGDGRFVYILESEAGAGGSILTLFVDDYDDTVGRIAARGLDPYEQETYGNGVRKATYRDPDGNEVGFGGAPSDADGT